jgi:radical SAM superfamily enzyme YgiQ (UPF0313 family)
MSKKIFLVEISPSVPSLGKSITMPRSGLLTIASILAEKSNHDVTLLFEPYVGTIDLDRIESAHPHYVLLNGLTTTAIENELLVFRLKKIMGGAFSVIIGGECATMLPEYAKRYADYVVLYEGDKTVISLLSALEENDQAKRRAKLSGIPGIMYKNSAGVWVSNKEPQRVKEIDYRYDFQIMPGSRNAASRFRLTQMPLQTSRGCRYNCTFCSWISLFGGVGYYVRPIEDVIHDIEHTVEYTGIRNFMVVDNLFAGDQLYTEELLRRILAYFGHYTRKPQFTVLCRADQFSGNGKSLPDRFLRLMRKAGVTHVSVGFESVNEDTLKRMRKPSCTSAYKRAVQRMHRFGFNIAATFVTGYGYDTYQDVFNIAHFAKSVGCFTIQIYCHAITPGTLDARRNPYLKIPGIPLRFANGHSVVTFPRQMLPSTLQKAVFEAAMAFYKSREPQKRLVGRIYRQIWKGIKPYYETLRRIETDILIPERLYVFSGQDKYILQEEKLQALADDSERYGDFVKQFKTCFDPIRYPLLWEKNLRND